MPVLHNLPRVSDAIGSKNPLIRGFPGFAVPSAVSNAAGIDPISRRMGQGRQYLDSSSVRGRYRVAKLLCRGPEPWRRRTDRIGDIGRRQVSVVLFDHARIGVAQILRDH